MIKYFMIFVLLFSVVGSAEEKDQWLNIYVEILGKKTKVGHVHRNVSHYKRKGKERIKVLETLHRYVSELGRVAKFSQELIHFDKKYRLKSKETTEFYGSKTVVKEVIKKSSIKITTTKNGRVSNTFLEKKHPIYLAMNTHAIAKKGKMKVGAKGKYDVLLKEEVSPYLYKVVRKEDISTDFGNFSTYLVKFQGQGITGRIFCKSNGEIMKGTIRDVRSPNMTTSFEQTTQDDAEKQKVPNVAESIKTFSTDRTFSLLLPSSFQKAEIHPKAEIQAVDIQRDLGLMVISESKQLAPVNLERYSSIVIAQTKKTLSEAESSSRAVFFDKKSAVQIEIFGKTKKIKLAYLITVIEREDYFTRIIMWTSAASFSGNKQLMQKITQSFESE